MNTVSLIINGTRIQAPSGIKLLPAALNAGIDIPHACYVPNIDPPVEECQLCVVEIDGRIVTACTEPVADGMVVITSNPELDRLRRSRLQFPG